MAHINTQLTRKIEIGAVRIDGQDGLEVVRKDNGRTVRNSRIEKEPRQWQVAFPVVDVEGNTDEYDLVRQMWSDTERGLHTFNFYCFVDDEVCKVRFDSPMEITADAGHLRKIGTVFLVEDE